MYEFDDSADFDAAPSSAGPWLHFYAKTSQDGIPPGSWALRDGGTTTVLDLSGGFVIDWRAVRTGWVQATGVPGVAPVKQWNPTRAKFLPRPPGDKWQKGFIAPLAYAQDAAALWEQWGAGVWMGFAEMFATLMAIAPQQLPNLPVIVPGAPIPQKFAQGPSLKPILTVSRFVPAPACLTEFIGQLPPPPLQPSIPAPAVQPPQAKPATDGWGTTPFPVSTRTPPAVKPPVWGTTPVQASDSEVLESEPLDDTIPF
jgi:hypothetical protein